MQKSKVRKIPQTFKLCKLFFIASRMSDINLIPTRKDLEKKLPSSSSESCCLDLWKFDRFIFEENPEETWGRPPILPLLGLVNEPEKKSIYLKSCTIIYSSQIFWMFCSIHWMNWNQIHKTKTQNSIVIFGIFHAKLYSYFGFF